MISNMFDHITTKNLGYFEPDPRRTMKSPTLILIETLEAFNARPVPVLTPSLKKEVGPAKRTSIAPKIAGLFIAALLALPLMLVTDIVMHGTGLAADVPKNLAPTVEHAPAAFSGYWGYNDGEINYRDLTIHDGNYTLGNASTDVLTIGNGTSSKGPITFTFSINDVPVLITTSGSWVELTCPKGLTCE